ncbi:MAG: hypothetical protein J6P19_04595 [Acetobacter sp.]|nr:hypothetical protein [Acetobacter sp.]
MDIKFYSQDHEKAFYSVCKRMSGLDLYHFTLAYLLTLDNVTREHIDDLFSFEDDGIKPEGINKSWQTGTSAKTTRLAFNLWNGCSSDGEDDTSPLYTPGELFCCSYAPYYYEAIRIRYPEYTGE